MEPDLGTGAPPEGGLLPEASEPNEVVLTDVPLLAPPPTAAPDAAPAVPGSAGVHELVNQYLHELRHDLNAPLTLPAPPPAVRRVYGGLALAATVLVAGVVAALVMLWNTGLPVWSREQIAAAPGGAACVERQEEVTDALAAYAGEHAGPAPSLDALRPHYLLRAPVDPTTGRAFLYRRDGASVVLTCPDHPLAPHADMSDMAPPAAGG